MKSNDFEKRLYVVATPIGNLGDMGRRAIDVLSMVDVILCENSQHSLGLFNHYGISAKKIFKLTEHESRADIDRYLSHCEQAGVALISDAGTPLISDPGKSVVEAAYELGFGVLAVPGPCAMIAALSICPFQAMPFQFHGFLSRKKGDRRAQLSALSLRTEAMVFYESPHRIVALLHDMSEVWGVDRQVFVVKELTKCFERYWYGDVSEVCQALSEGNRQGEFVVMVSGCDPEKVQQANDKETIDLELCIQALFASGVSVSGAKKILTPLVAMGKKALYQKLLAMHQSGDYLQSGE